MSAKFLLGFFGIAVLISSLFFAGVTRLGRVESASGCPALTSSGEVDPSDTVAFWLDSTLSPPLALNDNLTDTQKKVLGDSTGEKWIEVDLGKQKMIAHQGDQIFLESLISSGLWNSTPVGEYHIWYKIRSTKMEGGSRQNNTYYYLPNVPYSMFFYGDYGIHGTYWHSNFGHPMSHGCVNTPTTIAEKLYYWTDPQIPAGKYSVRSTAANPGTRIVIHK
jgi:lipoprotein-anchoring transpeptidase ErfK/SrfK